MKIFESSVATLEQFKNILQQIPEAVYTAPSEVLSQATIGQHTRHVIELYLCLLNGYDSSEVSYDKRKRDTRIENEPTLAIELLSQIQRTLERPNKEVQMGYELNGEENFLPSNYYREVMYNLEHAIHHHALIKIGIQQFTAIELPESFGVAPSTMQYRKACAQ